MSFAFWHVTCGVSWPAGLLLEHATLSANTTAATAVHLLIPTSLEPFSGFQARFTGRAGYEGTACFAPGPPAGPAAAHQPANSERSASDRRGLLGPRQVPLVHVHRRNRGQLRRLVRVAFADEGHQAVEAASRGLEQAQELLRLFDLSLP